MADDKAPAADAAVAEPEIEEAELFEAPERGSADEAPPASGRRTGPGSAR